MSSQSVESHGTGRGWRPGGFVLSADEEERLLEGVEESLVRGRELLAWWRRVAPVDGFAQRFELGRTFDEPDVSFGFFDETTVGGRAMPIMGNFQQMFYDRPKTPPARGATLSAEWMRDQMRRFVLRYFMRVSDFRDPEGYAQTWRPPGSGLFDPISWCPRPDPGLRGFGFQQLYYARTNGEIGRFGDEERFSIVDLRELGETYRWIVVKVCIFDFNFSFAPFGAALPRVVLPLHEDSFLAISSDFVADRSAPEPGVLGRYGLGYSFIKNPVEGLFGYGPGEFDAAFETIDFEVREDGSVRVPMAFVANRPERIVNLRLDPLDWGLRLADLVSFGTASAFLGPMRRVLSDLPDFGTFDPVYAYVDLARLLSGGLSEEALCISRQQLDREFLVKHFMQHYQTIAGSLATWRRIPDWLDDAALPEWVVRGRRL